MLHVDQRFAKLLGEFAMRRKINFIVLENQFVDKGLQKIVNVIATKMSVAVGGENLINVAVASGNELENGDIESAAAEIVDGDFAALRFMQAIGERGRGRLVDKAQNLEAGDFAGVLCGLALCIVEICRDGDDGAVDGFAEVGFSPILQFTQDKSGNFRRRENFFIGDRRAVNVAEFDADDIFARWIDAERKQLQFILDVGGAATHQALNGINGALGLREKTATRRFANGNTAIGIEADNRGTKRAAVRTLDTLRLARLRIKIGDEAVGGAEINADDTSHDCQVLSKNLRPEGLSYSNSF